MTAPSLGWKPLPDCSGCGRPTRRSTWERLGGRCSRCHGMTHPAAARAAGQLRDWQATVARIHRDRLEEEAARAARRRAKKENR